jgi:hypothetical protein
MADPCEWDPARNRPNRGLRQSDGRFVAEGCQHEAEFIVGWNGQWRLCASCARLPFFSRFRRRKRIEKHQEDDDG